jgi:hypothetical protein
MDVERAGGAIPKNGRLSINKEKMYIPVMKASILTMLVTIFCIYIVLPNHEPTIDTHVVYQTHGSKLEL